MKWLSRYVVSVQVRVQFSVCKYLQIMFYTYNVFIISLSMQHIISKEYIARNIEIDKISWCWNWKMSTSKGYWKISRRVNSKRITISSHRASLEIHLWKQIPEGKLVCHTCDNKKCCNPEHLFLWTHQDNMTDMKNKGRAKCTPRYWNTFNAKRISIDGEEFSSYTEAAKKYNITINGVKRRFRNRIIVERK